MASIKAIAAIAMTLIVAVPILMGYGFASTEEEVTDWETENTTNVTERLLNNSENYYTDYMNPLNNSVFLQTNVSQGSSTTTQVAPDYVSVSSKYSSIAEYGSGTENVTYSTVGTRSITYSGTDGLTHTFGNDADAEDSVTMSDYTYVYISSDTLTGIHWMLSFDGDYYYINSYLSYISLLFLRDSESTWTLYISEDGDEEKYGSISTWEISTDVDAAITIRTQAYAEITHSGSFGFDTLTAYTLKLVGNDSSVTYITNPESGYVYFSETGLATVDGTAYTGIESIYLANNTNYVTVTYTAATGNYADPADGWALPAGSGTAFYNYWMNGQENHEVRMMIHFSGTNYVILGPTLTASSSQLVQIYYNGNGTGVTVTNVEDSTSTFLGNYTDIMLVITESETTIYGLDDWPTMGVSPTTYNSVTVDYTDVGDSFYYVYMADDLNGYSNEVTYRVDSAEIVAGSYPITSEFNFYPDTYYPGQSVDFCFKSIASYGNDVNILNYDGSSPVGTVFGVTDGYVTVDGTTFKLLKSHIRIIENADGTWTTTFGGVEVMTTDEPTSIYFGGDWSLVATLDILEETTTSTQVWAPGEFAFEKEDFAACGMLVAGVCLVGLGMTGPRSGTKIGVLLMICGGAGLIYLTIL